MKRILMLTLVTIVFSIASQETKAQAAAGMGPGMIYRTDYAGVSYYFKYMNAAIYFAKKGGYVLIMSLATKGGMIEQTFEPAAPYFDADGFLVIPRGRIIYNAETGDDVSGYFYLENDLGELEAS